MDILLLELWLRESQSMGYFMEDQVEQHFRYVLSIWACYNVLQKMIYVTIIVTAIAESDLLMDTVWDSQQMVCATGQ